MKGYKVLNRDFTNRYGTEYEVGKIYLLNGELKWGSNGFHFCKRPEDTFRYIDGFNNDIAVVEVIGSDEVFEYNDEYYGYYDMYCSTKIEILREVPRDEYIDMIIYSNNFDRVKRLIQTLKLTQEEVDRIEDKHKNLLNFYIDYYQKKCLLIRKNT